MHDNELRQHVYRQTDRLTLDLHPAAAHHPQVFAEVSRIQRKRMKHTEWLRMRNGKKESIYETRMNRKQTGQLLKLPDYFKTSIMEPKCDKEIANIVVYMLIR